ncbi:MAG: hypothetical protein F4201_05695 [Nitrospira sp. SB0677_bin_15]|nr:hypothetical protein [Nitrospira sp. SB0667_bin_9]MYD30844.1 hypothetical protein [Nitrospira sp. SB0661_bin_20]MYG40291.1 hypothetical protein [Nitrospira sp. SB0677_bin_15]MYH01588.1 hypothetical protein [Nitrospira sp. SB0675_bin_23]
MPLSYLKWNDIIASHFFSEEKAGKEVLLYVNESLIKELGGPHGVGLDGFVAAVKTGPPWATKSGICQKALQTLEAWREKDLNYPPYIVYLALYVLAAGLEGNYAPHAYYPRLNDLLGEGGVTQKGRPPSFEQMIDLWDDLEKWSREDKNENLGRFVARIRGQWWMVGLPLSQTLISEDERRRLPLLLSERALDPSDLPSPEVILRLLRQAAGSLLQRRTLRVLDSHDSDAMVLRAALADVVIEELEAWDGSVFEEDHPGRRVEAKRTQTALRLCLKYDALAQLVTCRVRIKTASTIPDDGCTFVREGSDCNWMCKDLFGGWSSTLYDPADSRDLDGTALDWNHGERFLDVDNQWTATLRPATTRVFTPGYPEGLPDYIERQRLERNTSFLIATSNNVEMIKRWGDQHCSNFKQHSADGLPPGWILFSGENARHSCPGVDVLTISSTIRLLVRGGVKTERGNVYLKGAPPYIMLENALGTESVTLDTQILERDAHSNIWMIPDDAPEGRALRIEAHGHEQPLRKIIRLESPHLPLREDYTSFCRNPAGMPSQDSPQYACGAVVHYKPGDGPPTYSKDLPLHLSTHVTLVGATPGQIAVWPEEDLPDWLPVWAIVKTGRKQGKAVFCGTEEQAGRPYTKRRPQGERALVKRWKDVVWHNRKRIVPPELIILRKRWHEYMEAAKDVE